MENDNVLEVRYLCKQLGGLSASAIVTQLSRQTLHRWANGESRPRRAGLAALRAAVKDKSTKTGEVLDCTAPSSAVPAGHLVMSPADLSAAIAQAVAAALAANAPDPKPKVPAKTPAPAPKAPTADCVAVIGGAVLSRAGLEALEAQFHGADVAEEVQKMVDWAANSPKKYKDALAFARNWMRRRADEGAKPAQKQQEPIEHEEAASLAQWLALGIDRETMEEMIKTGRAPAVSMADLPRFASSKKNLFDNKA